MKIQNIEKPCIGGLQSGLPSISDSLLIEDIYRSIGIERCRGSITLLLRRACLITGLVTVLNLAGCGGGGGGGGEATPTEPIGDISGRWDVTEVVDLTGCGEGTETDNYPLTVTDQSGNSVTVVGSDGTYTGNLNGDILTWSGSFPEDGGTTTASTSLTIGTRCNSLSGSASWTWSDGASSCSGTTRVSADRVNPVGCGNSSSANAPVADLSGGWAGTVEDFGGNVGVITVHINGSEISGTTPDGSFKGTIAHEQGDIWGFTLSDGTEGGFLHDQSATHAVFVDEEFKFGVVQKGASGPSTYAGRDVVGSWEGTFVTVDADLYISSTGTASATVSSNVTFSGQSSAPDNFSGEIGYYFPRFGLWSGVNLPNITSTQNGSGITDVLLTNDKNFAGSYACFPNKSAFPTGCSFNLWNRQ